jgi:hypothetical protein
MRTPGAYVQHNRRWGQAAPTVVLSPDGIKHVIHTLHRAAGQHRHRLGNVASTHALNGGGTHTHTHTHTQRDRAPCLLRLPAGPFGMTLATNCFDSSNTSLKSTQAHICTSDTGCVASLHGHCVRHSSHSLLRPHTVGSAVQAVSLAPDKCTSGAGSVIGSTATAGQHRQLGIKPVLHMAHCAPAHAHTLLRRGAAKTSCACLHRSTTQRERRNGRTQRLLCVFAPTLFNSCPHHHMHMCAPPRATVCNRASPQASGRHTHSAAWLVGAAKRTAMCATMRSYACHARGHCVIQAHRCTAHQHTTAWPC